MTITVRTIRVAAALLVLVTTVAGAGSPAAVAIVIDQSVPADAAPAAPLLRVVSALRGSLTPPRADLRLAVWTMGAPGDDATDDCRAVERAVGWGPAAGARLASLDDLEPGRVRTPLAHALDRAGRDAASQSASTRRLILIVGARDGCGDDVCATAEQLRKRGVIVERVIVFADDDQLLQDLSCVGPVVQAASSGELSTAFAAALGDAGATSGIDLAHFAGGGREETVRFSLTPVPPPARRGAIAADDDARRIVHVPPGTYRLSFDDGRAPTRLVEVQADQITTVRSGRGTIVVNTLNFYGEAVAAGVEIWDMAFRRHGEAVAARPVERRIPHSTIPVTHAAPEMPASTTAASQPSTAPSSRPASMPTSQPSTAPSARPATPVTATVPLGLTATTRTGQPVDVEAGLYRVVMTHAGATIERAAIRVTPGDRKVVTFQLGGIRLERGLAPMAVYDPTGARIATARPYGIVHVPPGRYRLVGSDGSQQIEVAAGDVTLVE